MRRNVALLLITLIHSLSLIDVSHSNTDKDKKPSANRPVEDDVTWRVIVILCVIIILITGAIVGYCYWRSIADFKKYNTPRPELLELTNDKKLTMNGVQLKEYARTVLSYYPQETYQGIVNLHDQPKIDQFMSTLFERKQEDEEKATGKLDTIATARDQGKLPIRKHNRVTLTAGPSDLHISKLFDFYSNPIYLSAAPLAAQFKSQWEAVWQEKIGVLVWIGRLTLDRKIRMDSYISMEEGGSVTYGNFVIKTVRASDRYNRFSCFNLSVQKGTETREVVLIYAYEWLQDSVSWAMRRDMELLVFVKDQHVAQITLGNPGLLIQCKLGTAGSNTFLAVYIGYQTWMRAHKANVHGIIRYIRRQRWMAFEFTGDPSHTMLMQVQIVFAIMTGVARFVETGKVPICEQWIKDIWGQDRKSLILGT